MLWGRSGSERKMTRVRRRATLVCSLAALWALTWVLPAGAETAFSARIGVNRVNLRGKLVLTSPMRPGQSWGPPPQFPTD